MIGQYCKCFVDFNLAGETFWRETSVCSMQFLKTTQGGSSDQKLP